jgi:hypothetical protein
MLVTSSIFPMDMEDSGLLGTRVPVPRATDFSIAAIIGRSSRAAAEVLKLKGKNKILSSTMRPLGE